MARLGFLTARRVLGGLGLIGVAAGVWWGTPLVVRELGFFRVRQVDVVGATWIAPETIVRAMQLRRGASIADPTEPLVVRALTVPGVAEAAVTRRLPGALVVTIRERQPVAYVPVDGALAPMDARGRVMPYDARRGAASLPIMATADAKAGRLLARLREAEPKLYAAVQGGRVEGNDVVLTTEQGQLRFNSATKDETMRAVRVVGERLTAEGKPWGELDGRFAGMVIQRGIGT